MVHRSGGREVDARADEFFAVFERASTAALEAARAILADACAAGPGVVVSRSGSERACTAGDRL